jgi:dihydrofolate synthase/folylpolyglutamate synthase
MAESGRPSPGLAAALDRLDALVDWERRERAPRDGTAGRVMRQSVAPARDLLDRLGAPDRELSCLLVAGTKGKGSVAAAIAAGLRRAGRAEAVYASPHVERLHERVRLRGAEIEDAPLTGALEAALDAREAALVDGSAAADATWFDVLTAAALHAMRDDGVEWAVLECGLGGRLDSTNAVAPELGVLTNVALEHTAILGTTRAAIAREKAGIARAGRPLVSAVGPPGDEAADEVARVAAAVGAELVTLPCDPGDSLAARNRAVAGRVLDLLGGGLSAALLEGLPAAETLLPGRMERLSVEGVEVVLDGAHVPESLELLLRDLAAAGLAGRANVVLGTGADKDAPGLLKVLRGRVDRVLCTSPGTGPYASPTELLLEARRQGVPAEAVADPGAALEIALKKAGRESWVLVTGSLHLVGRVRGALVRGPLGTGTAR